MPRMLDLIRVSAVPSNIVQSAAKGSLSMPAPEMVEILVHLATHSKLFGEQASLTLAGWDENSSRAIAADPKTPKEILDYMVSAKNLRPGLLPALLANPEVSESPLAELASTASREVVDMILKSSRAEHSYAILKALHSNPNLSGIQAEQIRSYLSPGTAERRGTVETSSQEAAQREAIPSDDPSSPGSDDVLDNDLASYLTEHADEIAAQEKPFQPIGGLHESILESEEPETTAAAATVTGSTTAAAAKPAKKAHVNPEEQRGSALQKISRLDVKGRIQLAMKGSKEERSILVRDGTKVVALAVLDSPKITDGEVEKFASQKNVLESVLRGITMKRRFMKNYNVVRNLTSNPRTPLDLALGLMKNILVNDLKTISGNKDVSDTIRKLALKMYKQKKDPAK